MHVHFIDAMFGRHTHWLHGRWRWLTTTATEIRPELGGRVRVVKGSNSAWKSVVGLEVHAQMEAQSKLFSRSPHSPLAPPNSTLTLFDAAIPGTLPALNRVAVEAAIKTAIALQCQVG